MAMYQDEPTNDGVIELFITHAEKEAWDKAAQWTGVNALDAVRLIICYHYLIGKGWTAKAAIARLVELEGMGFTRTARSGANAKFLSRKRRYVIGFFNNDYAYVKPLFEALGRSKWVPGMSGMAVGIMECTAHDAWEYATFNNHTLVNTISRELTILSGACGPGDKHELKITWQRLETNRRRIGGFVGQSHKIELHPTIGRVIRARRRHYETATAKRDRRAFALTQWGKFWTGIQIMLVTGTIAFLIRAC